MQNDPEQRHDLGAGCDVDPAGTAAHSELERWAGPTHLETALQIADSGTFGTQNGCLEPVRRGWPAFRISTALALSIVVVLVATSSTLALFAKSQQSKFPAPLKEQPNCVVRLPLRLVSFWAVARQSFQVQAAVGSATESAWKRPTL